jgi:hypothetical protein
MPPETLNSLYEHATTLIDFRFDLSLVSSKDNTQITHYDVPLTTDTVYYYFNNSNEMIKF